MRRRLKRISIPKSQVIIPQQSIRLGAMDWGKIVTMYSDLSVRSGERITRVKIHSGISMRSDGMGRGQMLCYFGKHINGGSIELSWNKRRCLKSPGRSDWGFFFGTLNPLCPPVRATD